MNENQYDVIVIGAGHNGLVTAGYLAKDGLKVLVVERLDHVGGACTTDEFSPGFSAPMCAYISHLLQGKVVDDLKLKEHGLDFVYTSNAKVSSSSIHPFPDGKFLGGPGVNDHMDKANQIRQFSEQDAHAYFEWVTFWEQASGILNPYFLTEPPTLAELVDSVRGSRREEILEKMLTWSYIDLIEDHFEEDHVKAHFMSHDTEMDPSAPGSILGVALHGCGRFTRNEHQGIPVMSMGTITKSMANAAIDYGAEIRVGAPVKEIIVEDGTAKGVRLTNGEEILSFIVACNADPKTTFTSLVDQKDVTPQTLKGVRNWKTKAGCAKFLAAMKELPDLSRYLGNNYDRRSVLNINIMPSVDYHQQSWDDAKNGKPTSCPLMGIQLTSIAEPALVRGQGHVMSNWVLYETPDLREGTWEDVKTQVGEQIIDVITEYAPNFRESLIDWTLQTPTDIETRVGMTDGNIRHLDLIPSQLLSQRQPYRTDINRFYMCGAGTHPMGEVTGAPGHNAAHAILKDLQ